MVHDNSSTTFTMPMRCLHFAILWSLEDELAQDNKATISHAAPATGLTLSGTLVWWPLRRADQGRPVGISCFTMTKTTKLDDSHHDESSALATSRCSSYLSRTAQTTTIAPQLLKIGQVRERFCG